ncbi:IPT/TIG domain-containing protein [Chitinophaga nivalis]|uniref:IPT/TIG domain-containing protein n=1 Tax=Chitinophaga nivalis TaxID=2991709 RepID=A0ABT3IQY4_9BACT|nr:IPT/TIG domain-containing protein [Chitinophaga nivalis]MCW3463933.1 IPT/TIG domain-containing protein [Chitinophaga nivalis]MCW3486377.1 IPT/TIG domain-containing protein [Chitinophaga nivalis]
MNQLKRFLLLLIPTIAFLQSYAQYVSIDGFAPLADYTGGTVTIFGNGFGSNPPAHTVYFGPAKAYVKSVGMFGLEVIVPHGTGYGPVSVSYNGYTSYSANPFTPRTNWINVASHSYTNSGEYTLSTGFTRYAGLCDMDADGKPDIVGVQCAANGQKNELFILHNKMETEGPAEYQYNAVSNTIADPKGMVLEDIDNDGLRDIVVASGKGTVSIFMNTSVKGNLQFRELSVPLGTIPLGIQIGDFDKDKLSDMAILTATNQIRFYKNKSTYGNIQFASTDSVEVGRGNGYLLRWDIDRDGRPDIISVNETDNTISILINTSEYNAMSFAPVKTVAVGQQPVCVKVADLNNDYVQEIIVGNAGSQSLSIIRAQNVNGQTDYTTVQTIPVGVAMNDIQLTDFNGDRNLDLALSNRAAQGPVLLALNGSDQGGNISFLPFVQVPSGGNGQQLIVGDINLDNSPDIVTAGSTVISLLHTGKIPEVQRFTPATSGRGEATMIIGSSFDYATSVTFGGTPADSFRVVNADTIIAYVGKGQSGNITVTTPIGTSSIGGFVFNEQPVIRKVTPLAAKTGDTILIEGVNLDNTTNVTFGGEPASFFRINTAVSISAVVGAGYSGDIKVFNTNDSAVYNGFVVKATPVISSFTPLSARSGDTIHIYGYNFAHIKAITIGGVPADTFGGVSPGRLIAIVGSGATGDIVVTTAYGTDSKSGFSYSDFPAIIQVAPMAGDNSTTITITGNNFNKVTAVSFGGVPATSFTIVSPTTITAIPGNGNNGKVMVTNAAGTAVKEGFTYTSTPFITAITPARSSNGATVRISGAKFSGITAVTIGNVAATTYTVEADTVITATTGAFAPGKWTVAVSNETHTATYNYFYNGPIIHSFSPASGAAGSLVTINGANFNTDPLRNIVYFGATKAVVKSATTGTLVVAVPTGALPEPISVASDGLIAYTANAFLPTFQGTDSALTAGSFAAPIQIDGVASISNIFITDLDGDSLPDIFLTRKYDRSFSVFRNNGSYGVVSFDAKKDFYGGYDSQIAAVADFNGDGLSDVAAESLYGNDIGIFRNTSTIGNISFYEDQRFNSGKVTAMAAADLDGDGSAELVTGSTSAQQLRIYANQGTRDGVSLRAITDVLIAGFCNGITIADVDGDGRPDIMLPNSAGHFISILRNTSTPGHLSFAPFQNLRIDGGSSEVLLKDMDGDNKPDLIFLFNKEVGIFKNNSRPGKIAFTDRITAHIGRNAGFLTVADFDGDNLLDVAVGNEGITLFKNTSSNGQISLATGVFIKEYIAGITSGDLNGDGKPDLIGINYAYTKHRLSIYKNNAAKHKEPLISTITPNRAIAGDTVIIRGKHFIGATAVGLGGISVAAYKVLADSVIKAVVAAGKTGYVHVTTPYGTATLAGFVSPPHITAFTPASGKIGDTITITGSGLNSAYLIAFGRSPEQVDASYTKALSPTTVKAVVGDGASGNIYIYGNDGVDSISGFTFIPPPPEITSFTPQPANSGAAVTITGKYFTHVSSVKFGGVPADSVIILSDKKMIVIVGKGASGEVTLTSPTGTGSRSGFICLPGSPQITGFTPDKGNIGTRVTIRGRYFHTTPDKNTVYFGAVRAVVLEATDTTLTVSVPLGASHQPITVTANGLTAQASKAFTVTFAGGVLNAGSFVKSASYQIGSFPANLQAHDLDGDQQVDLVAAYVHGSGVKSVLQNKGGATFGAVQTTPIGISITDAELTDMDGDGNRDLVVSQGADFLSVGVSRNISVPGKISFDTHKMLELISLADNRMTTGDIDGDGRPDVYVMSLNGKSARIGRNISTDSTMKLEELGYMGFSFGAFAATICDMDGDGRREILTAAPGDGGVVIYTNNSLRGIISLGKRDEIHGMTYRVWAVDLDGDNKPELITSLNSNTLAIHKNNATPGNIVMGTRIELPLGYTFDKIAVGDLDGDGKPDLAVPGGNDKKITVFRNLSDNNQLSFAPRIDYTADGRPASIVISDLNADGKPDIATADMDGTVSVYLNKMNAALQPVIRSFTPDSAKHNSVVTISGQRFTGATGVSFGGRPATSFQVLNDTTITAVVAYGNNGIVAVVTPVGVASKDSFVFIPETPVLTRFSPASGTRRTKVTITGKFLTGTKAVTFGGMPAQSFTIVSDSVVTAIVGGGNSGHVVVAGEIKKDSLPGFTYLPPVPVIAAFTPAVATKLDTVTIKGQQLDLVTSVSFGGVAAKNFIVINDSTLKAIVGDGKSGNIDVQSPAGTATHSGFIFKTPLPVLSDVIPYQGREGDTITLSGYNLQWVNAVSFGGVAATSIRVLSDNTVTAVLGKGAAGTVRITSPGGSAEWGAFGFIYPAPKITGFSPMAAKSGKTITIKGTGLSGVYEVFLGGAATKNLTALSDSVITVTVGEGATGPVKVTGYWGTDTLSEFTFIEPNPVITHFSPAIAAKGETVTIYGQDLQKAYAVTFGGAYAASMKLLSDSVITAVVGDGASGEVSVLLRTGNEVTRSGFTYRSPGIIVWNFSPARATTGGTVFIYGSDFHDITDVQFGGVSASSFELVSSAMVTAVVGPGASGAVTVIAGDQRSEAQGFTFLPQPIIDSFTPATAQEGSIVMIRGRSFSGATHVIFGGQTATSFTVVTDNLIRATVGKGASGDVMIALPTGATGKRSGFIFLNDSIAITVAGFTPASGAAGATITITGKGFRNATAVSFGGVPAAAFRVISDSVISAVVGNGGNGAVDVSSRFNFTSSLDGFTYLGEAAPLRFYPNPAVGYTWIDHPVSNEAKLFLLNLAGDILRVIPATPGSGKTQFNLSGIQPGYYYISWRDGSQSISKAIVISQ